MDSLIRTKDQIKIPISKEWLDAAFYNHVTRIVKNHATILINKVSYVAPQQFIGMKVNIHFLPGQINSR